MRDDEALEDSTLAFFFIENFSLLRAEKLNVDSVGGGELANTIPSR